MEYEFPISVLEERLSRLLKVKKVELDKIGELEIAIDITVNIFDRQEQLTETRQLTVYHQNKITKS